MNTSEVEMQPCVPLILSISLDKFTQPPCVSVSPQITSLSKILCFNKKVI